MLCGSASILSLHIKNNTVFKNIGPQPEKKQTSLINDELKMISSYENNQEKPYLVFDLLSKTAFLKKKIKKKKGHSI